MDAIELHISDRPSPEETNALLQGLIAYNEAQAGPASARDLAVIARCEGKVVGGLIGLTHWNWLHIRFLWVAEEMRHQGLGSRLLLAGEQEAIVRGCDHAHLDTFSFQAQPFYERHGYEVFGRLEDYPSGCTRIFLQKRSLGGSPPREAQ